MGMFLRETWDHPKLIVAREQRDDDALDFWLRKLRLPNGKLDTTEYVRVDQWESENLITLEGEMFILNAALAAKNGETLIAPNAALGWYFAEFENDATPLVAWTAASFASGGAATEFTGYDEETRQAAVFPAASGSSVVSTLSASATITVSTGVTKTIYGIGLLSNSTKLHSGSGATLLAATKYTQTKAYGAGQSQIMKYQLYSPA